MIGNTASKKLFSTVIVGAKRTPIGSFMGSIKELSAPHLGTVAARAALASCELDPKEVEEVYMGAVLQGGMGQAPDRQAALFAGLSTSVPCTAVNKVTISGRTHTYECSCVTVWFRCVPAG